eukprot:6214568-Pleurochrysis_carterae.AAC.4
MVDHRATHASAPRRAMHRITGSAARAYSHSIYDYTYSAYLQPSISDGACFFPHLLAPDCAHVSMGIWLTARHRRDSSVNKSCLTHDENAVT